MKDTQREILEWVERTFGPVTTSERALMLAEETGEVCRCVVKTQQGVRPSTRSNLPDELADVGIVLLCFAEYVGIDLETEIKRRFEEAQQREYERDE
jgi:NTP pyrophosphatase (non-canonical NTP hydrolase)